MLLLLAAEELSLNQAQSGGMTVSDAGGETCSIPAELLSVALSDPHGAVSQHRIK